MLNIFAVDNWAKWALKMDSLSIFHKMYRSPRVDVLTFLLEKSHFFLP